MNSKDFLNFKSKEILKKRLNYFMDRGWRSKKIDLEEGINVVGIHDRYLKEYGLRAKILSCRGSLYMIFPPNEFGLEYIYSSNDVSHVFASSDLYDNFKGEGWRVRRKDGDRFQKTLLESLFNPLAMSEFESEGEDYISFIDPKTLGSEVKKFHCWNPMENLDRYNLFSEDSFDLMWKTLVSFKREGWIMKSSSEIENVDDYFDKLRSRFGVNNVVLFSFESEDFVGYLDTSGEEEYGG